MDGNEVIEPLHERLTGRVAAADIKHPETGEVVKYNELINENTAKRIAEAGLEKVLIRRFRLAAHLMAFSNVMEETWPPGVWWMWVKQLGSLPPNPLANPELS